MELKRTPIHCGRCGLDYSDIVVYLRHTIIMNCKESDLTKVEMEALLPLKKKWETIAAELH